MGEEGLVLWLALLHPLLMPSLHTPILRIWVCINNQAAAGWLVKAREEPWRISPTHPPAAEGQPQASAWLSPARPSPTHSLNTYTCRAGTHLFPSGWFFWSPSARCSIVKSLSHHPPVESNISKVKKARHCQQFRDVVL